MEMEKIGSREWAEVGGSRQEVEGWARKTESGFLELVSGNDYGKRFPHE